MKHIYCLLIHLSFGFLINLNAQYRDIRGFNNNLTNTDWGAVNTHQLDVVPIAFEDGFGSPAGSDRPNPRVISNEIFHQDGLIMDQNNLSDYVWVWGQFIDHDITLVGENHEDPFPIEIPKGDIYFDPHQTGNAIMPVSRSTYDHNTGTGIGNHRKFPNEITAFIDGSVIYGVSHERMNWLRSFRDGKLKVSEGNLLPFNTYSGELEAPVDPNAPDMAMPFAHVTKYFVSGDVRANENILLLSMHTLFVREHNRICDQLKSQHPDWNDDQLFYRAKKMVSALISSVVYNEWLPALGVHLSQYTGYKPSVNPCIMNVFSGAAYRFGHTIISDRILRLNEYGLPIPAGNIHLKDAFFNPQEVVVGGGLDPLFRGMSTQVQQDFDTKIISDLRNFLFGAPGSGGLDLAAINIQRGRERGLPDYNSIRSAFGLEPIADFTSLSSNIYLNQKIKNLYQNINAIDPWVGFLAEDHLPGSLFGESVMHIVSLQFLNLRDGDRLFYLNDPTLTAEDIEWIESSTLSQIVQRNTGANNISTHVFTATPLTVSDRSIENTLNATIYPNPSSGLIQVDIPGDCSPCYIDMISVDGRLLDHSATYDTKVIRNIQDYTGLMHLIIRDHKGMSSATRVVITQ